LPVWQQKYPALKASGADLLSIAVDLQGADKARPYHEAAHAGFVTVVDEENALARLFGYNAIPNAVFVDEDGIVQFQYYGGFNINDKELSALVDAFVADGSAVGARQKAGDEPASDHFERGLSCFKDGDIEGAASIWREGIALDPQNWNMRKQLWAVENPDRFYDGAVDYGWQKEQIEAGL
jgi:hypothetical protein